MANEKHQAALNKAIEDFHKTYPQLKHVILVGIDPNNPPSYHQLMEELYNQMRHFNNFNIITNQFIKDNV